MQFSVPPFDYWAETDADTFIQSAERYVLRLRTFYDSRAQWHRRLYRLSGVLVITIGVALPVTTTLEGRTKDVTIAVGGLLVALLTGLRSFYRWDRNWSLLRRTEIDITALYLAWKGSPAQIDPDPDTRRRAAVELLETAADIRRAESGLFFKNIPTSPEATHNREDNDEPTR